MKWIITLLLFAGWQADGLAGEAHQINAAGRSAEEIRECSQANLPEETMVQSMEMVASDVDGNQQRLRTRFFLKRYGEDDIRATLQVRAPLDLNGVSYLMIDKNSNDQLYLYLPAVGRIRRISGKQASDGMLGTDFSYEDIKQLRAVSSGGEVTRMGEQTLAGRAVTLLELRPAPDDESAYDRILFAVDDKTCVALTAEFYEPGARHVKTLEADPESLEQIEGRWLARKLKMSDLDRGTHTDMTLLDVEYDSRISNGIFNPSSFYLAATVGTLSPTTPMLRQENLPPLPLLSAR